MLASDGETELLHLTVWVVKSSLLCSNVVVGTGAFVITEQGTLLLHLLHYF